MKYFNWFLYSFEKEIYVHNFIILWVLVRASQNSCSVRHKFDDDRILTESEPGLTTPR